MSRGPGTFQRRLIDELTDEWTLVNALYWRLRATEVRTRVDKAIKSLARRGCVSTLDRTLVDFAEVVRLFPFKTRDAAVRDWRARLLPTLARYRPLARAEERRRRWSVIEASLLHAATNAARRDLALPVVWTGRRTFGIDRNVRDDRSLADLIARARRAWPGDAPRALEAADRLSAATLGIAPVSVHDRIHDLVEMNHEGTSVLRPEVEAFLRRRVTRLPSRGILDQILTRKALERFRFVRLVDAE